MSAAEALPFSPRYRHVGGSVINALGRSVPLAEARQLGAIWAQQAEVADRFGRRALARLLARDALAILLAASAAFEWRRAAGWADPFQADGAAA